MRQHRFGWLGVAGLVALVVFAAAVARCMQPQSVTCASGRICLEGQHCAAKQDICIVGNCGNGIPDILVGELCDEGVAVNGMPGHCSSDCASRGTCGNGIMDQGEQCDYCVDEPRDGGGSGGSGGSGGAGVGGADAGAGSDAA